MTRSSSTSSMTTTNAPPLAPATRSAAPQLMFDDGSRAMAETAAASATAAGITHGSVSSTPSLNAAAIIRRDDITVRDYYEVDRLVHEIRALIHQKTDARHHSQNKNDAAEHKDDGIVSFRVALQFPDECLRDAPAVCWEFESALMMTTMTAAAASHPHILVFVLGDTTYAPCCPDQVAAAHLQADCLIHYGHACLSSNNCSSNSSNSNSSSGIPVLYSFGKQALHVDACARAVRQQIEKDNNNNNKAASSDAALTTRAAKRKEKILLLYQVQYSHAIPQLQRRLLQETDTIQEVWMGQIPSITTTSSSITPPQNKTTTATATTTTTACSTSSPSCGTTGRQQQQRPAESSQNEACAKGSDCCQTTGRRSSSSCLPPWPTSTVKDPPAAAAAAAGANTTLLLHEAKLVVGGLELPKRERSATSSDNKGQDNDNDDDDDCNFSDCILLFVGDDTSRQYLNIVLRFISGPAPPPKQFWTWQPCTTTTTNQHVGDEEGAGAADDEDDGILLTQLSPAFSRQLNRRFYLVQKARHHCSVFGILVANLSDAHLRLVVSSLRQVLQAAGRTSYVLVVGKMNPAKLANFAEMDCFVLVACPEHALLLLQEDERDYPTPVLTPLEVTMALGVTEWGSRPYSLDRLDFLALTTAPTTTTAGNGGGGENDDDQQQQPDPDEEADDDANKNGQEEEGDDDDDDDDAPYYSLVTGRYEAAPGTRTKNQQLEQPPQDLAALPGQGQLSTYTTSAAANFLQQREYQGLVVAAGETAVRAAVPGQEGIASDYREKKTNNDDDDNNNNKKNLLTKHKSDSG